MNKFESSTNLLLTDIMFENVNVYIIWIFVSVLMEIIVKITNFQVIPLISNYKVQCMSFIYSLHSDSRKINYTECQRKVHFTRYQL